MSASVLHPPGAGPVSYIVNDRHTIKLSSADGAGRLGVSEMWLEPGAGAPPHRHANEDEFFYIIEGEVTFIDGENSFILRPGESIFLPRGGIHGFSNRSSQPARVLLGLTPCAGFEAFCKKCGTNWSKAEPPPQAVVMAAVERMMANAKSFGIEMFPDFTPTRFGTPATERTKHNVLGDPVEILTSHSDSGGRLGVVRVTSMPGGGPPPHIHDRGDEAFYILDGEIEVLSNGKWIPLTAGAFAYNAPGQLHTYRNRGAKPATFLVLFTPAGFDEMFRELGQLSMPPAMGQVVEICRRWDSRFV